MKKYLMMVVVALMATTGVKAQNEEMTWSFMPKVGWNLCTWAGDPDAKWMSGYMGGFEVEYGLSDNVGLVAGLNYSLQGEKDDVNKTKIMFGYTNVPLLVQYYPVKGLALKAGAQLGFLTSKKAKVDGVKIDIDRLESFYGADAGFRKFDLAIPLGISYEYANFVIDARYNLGLIGIVKGYDKTMRNSVFQFSLGYKIPFSN
jgi:hypothetical protein